METAQAAEAKEGLEGVRLADEAEFGELTPQEVITRLDRYMEEAGMSQAKVAKAIGIGTSTMSQVISGVYEGDVEGVINRVKEFLGLEKPPWQLVQTANLNAVEKACEVARRRGKFCVVVGRAGFGKTEGLKHYRRGHGCFYVPVNASFTPKVLMGEILRSLGAESSLKSLHELLTTVIGHLRKRQSPLLLVDEADLLSVKSLELIRAIHDATRCGVVLAGLNRLEDLMRKGTTLRDNLAQLYSRVSGIVHLGPISTAECNAILDQVGVRQASAREYVAERVAIDGMRKLRELILNAQELTRKNGHKGQITLEVLRQAESYLM
jgi:DNA transposition AAA+ family ATPase